MSAIAAVTSKPRLELAGIVRMHAEALRAQISLNSQQQRALADIARCRSAELGGFVYRCLDCGLEQPQYCSCGNRHCPKCQVLEQYQWVQQRSDKVLDVPHWHIVFTLPSQLRSLVRYRPAQLYALLMRCAADTLLEFTKHPRRSQFEPAVPGITQLLHTWTRQLTYHPHVHCIMTAGGLSLDRQRWVGLGKKFLFSVKALAKVFAGKFRDGLRKLSNAGALLGFQDFDDPQGFDRLMRTITKLPWCVYVKKSLRQDTHVFRYLAQYTHRVGIANSRLVSMHDGLVTFRSKEGKLHTVTGVEFLRRFIQHVLPPGFVKIRHYGLYAAGNVPTKLEQARALLVPSRHNQPQVQPSGSPPAPTPTWQQSLQITTGRDVSCCPRCRSLAWRPMPLARNRAPPAAVA